MFKKLLALTLCLTLALCFTACKKKPDDTASSSVPVVSSEPPKPITYINPLTGENDLNKSQALRRSVAVMVNNISVAQPVQTGLNYADVVYETEVEGGITRLLAVFKDFKSVKQLGTIRSARYDFIDLALGHGAIYAHHGQDNYHAGGRLGSIDRIVIGTNNGGSRISNGLSSEHTLYGYGDKLWATIEKMGINTKLKSEEKPWQTFAKEEETVAFEKNATTVSAPFNSSYNTVFKYDTATKRYTRYFGTAIRKDYKTGEAVTVKNVFILNSTITPFPGCSDGKGHRKVYLNGGTGYYCVNGTYTAIKWTKKGTNSPVQFTKTDGSELTVDVGNSWVCIVDGSRSKAKFS